MQSIKGQTTRKQQEQKRYRRKIRKKRFLCSILAIIFLALVGICVRYVGNQDSFIIKGAPDQKVNGITINLKSIHSKDLILIDTAQGSTLVSQNSNKKVYPASLTKIMTALIAIERTQNMEQTITMPSDIYESLYEQNASMAGFVPGEKVRKKDLLYGILLPSGAECCEAYAKNISGSEKDFVKLMNQKAKELGMSHTNYTNCTGLHDSKNYTTVEDLSILVKYAIKNQNFREIFTSNQYCTKATKQHPDGITFHSTMFSNMDSAKVNGGQILGGKTGYTDEAGLCLASLASINGKEYVLITTDAEGTHSTEQFHIQDAINIYNQLGAG